jgi:sec-independent protein translocase protein TatB
MFDISWTEFLLIGVVALVVIGPKELPGVMRTMGQWTRKIRGMATEFQNQFQEAMREAEMADLKKQVDDLAGDIKNADPLKSVRDDVETMGRDIEKSFAADTGTKAVEPPAQETGTEALPPPQEQAQTSDAAAVEQQAQSAAAEPAAPLPLMPEPAPEPAAATTEPASAEPASTERTG